jgi:hypothetical protein
MKDMNDLQSTVLRLAAAQLTARHPQGFGRTLSTIEFYLGQSKEIRLGLANADRQLAREVWNNYLPGKVVVSGRITF